MKKALAVCTTALLAIGLAVGGVTVASATGGTDACVPADAWTETISEAVPATEAVYETKVVKEAGWQRYSFKGAWPSNTDAPPFPGNWQANTASDPHGVGVAGAYFRSNGNSGNGDWFYLEAVAAVTEQVLITPATPAVDAVTKDHPAVVCEDEPETPEEPAVVPNSLALTHTVDCGVVTITLRNVSPWIYPTSVKIDGAHSYGPTVDNRTDGKLSGPQKDASKTRTITFAEDSGTHTVEYRIDAGSERNLYVGTPLNEWVTVPVETDCEANAPTYLPTCDTVTGSTVITGDGVLSVEGDWATDSIAVPFSGTLADIGTSSTLNIDATPLQFVGLHIDTAEGTLVFEEEASYAGNLWSTTAWDGVEAGLGYAAFGSIEQFVHLNGDVAVTGIRLLYTHPEKSSTTVKSFTIGCTEYTFKPEETKPPVVTDKPAAPASLAHTGGGDMTPLAVLAGLLMAAGLWVIRKVRASL